MNELINIVISYSEEVGLGLGILVTVFILERCGICKDYKTKSFASVFMLYLLACLAVHTDMFVFATITFGAGTVLFIRSLWGNRQKKILKQEVDYIIEEEIAEALRGAMLDISRDKKIDEVDDYMTAWGDVASPVSRPKDNRWMKNILK